MPWLDIDGYITCDEIECETCLESLKPIEWLEEENTHTPLP